MATGERGGRTGDRSPLFAFTVAGLTLPSVNRKRGQHWAAALRPRRDWSLGIRAAIGRSTWRANGRRVRVTLTRVAPRMIDPTNIDEKAIMDGLTDWGLIVDDSPKWVEVPRAQQRIGPAATEVLLEVIP